MLWEKAVSYDLAGKNEEALKFFQEFIKYAGPEEQNYVGKVRERIEQLRAKPEKPPDNSSEAYYKRGSAYLKKGHYDLAIADFTQTLKINPQHADAYINRGASYFHKKLYDQAIADLDQALKINPNSAVAYHDRGMAYGRKSLNDLAIADFTRAINIDPNYASSYNMRAVAYYYLGQYAKAWADVHKAESLGSKPNTILIEKLNKVSGRKEEKKPLPEIIRGTKRE